MFSVVFLLFCSLSGVVGNACLYAHLEPVTGASPCISSGAEEDACGTNQFCVSGWAGGVCCQYKGGKPPVCPNDGILQHGKFGSSCFSTAECSGDVATSSEATCVIGDPDGYQNTNQNAKFCCLSKPKTTTTAPLEKPRKAIESTKIRQDSLNVEPLGFTQDELIPKPPGSLKLVEEKTVPEDTAPAADALTMGDFSFDMPMDALPSPLSKAAGDLLGGAMGKAIPSSVQPSGSAAGGGGDAGAASDPPSGAIPALASVATHLAKSIQSITDDIHELTKSMAEVAKAKAKEIEKGK